MRSFQLITNGWGESLMGNLKFPGILGPTEPEKPIFLAIKITSRYIVLNENYRNYNNINKLDHLWTYISFLFNVNIQT